MCIECRQNPCHHMCPNYEDEYECAECGKIVDNIKACHIAGKDYCPDCAEELRYEKELEREDDIADLRWCEGYLAANTEETDERKKKEQMAAELRAKLGRCKK